MTENSTNFSSSDSNRHSFFFFSFRQMRLRWLHHLQCRYFATLATIVRAMLSHNAISWLFLRWGIVSRVIIYSRWRCHEFLPFIMLHFIEICRNYIYKNSSKWELFYQSLNELFDESSVGTMFSSCRTHYVETENEESWE